MVIYLGNNLKINDGDSKNEYSTVAIASLPLYCYRGLPYVETATILRERDVTKGIKLLLYLTGSGIHSI